jgi:hypothetical protein
MSDVISSLKAALLGRRDSGLSIPIMDGAFKPNNLLETAAVFAERPGLEDLALDANGALHAACGKSVFRIDAGGGFTQIATFDRDVTALALMKGGAMAVALGDAVLISGDGVAADRVIDQCDGRKFVAVNALHARADGTLLITDGSTAQPYPAWSRDLLDSGASGRLLAHDLRANKTCVLASNLAYAFGAYSDATGGVLVSESWRHRLDAVANTKRTPALAALPGYPSRMSAASDGGFWLSVFACRTQLVEFVLREDNYREEMMRTIESQYWVAPALSSGDDFLEPLQGGGVKQMGILKPWAPPRSYGLVVRVGADMIPKYSLHSRVGGKHHGIVSVAQKHDDLYVLSKGSGRILKLSVREFESGASQ